MERAELLKEAEAIKARCYYMLENAPQAMSNVSTILNVLRAVTQLIEHIEQRS